MEKQDVLREIRQVVEDEWAASSAPVLLSKLPRILEHSLGEDYRSVFEEKPLKTFLHENYEEAGILLVQDPNHHARVGMIPLGKTYAFPASMTSQITAADARAFGRVLGTMTAEEQRAAALPVSFVARLLDAS